MKKSLFILALFFLFTNAFSQDMFWAFKTEFNKQIFKPSVSLSNYGNYGNYKAALNDISFGLFTRKHIFANFHVDLQLQNKTNNLNFGFYTAADTTETSIAIVLETQTIQTGLGIEYVFMGNGFLKLFVAGHIFYSYTYFEKAEIKETIYAGKTTDYEGDEINDYDYQHLALGKTMENVLYTPNYTEIMPAFEFGLRFQSSAFFEPSIMIKPNYNQFLIAEKDKPFYFMFNLKIGDVF